MHNKSGKHVALMGSYLVSRARAPVRVRPRARARVVNTVKAVGWQGLLSGLTLPMRDHQRQDTQMSRHQQRYFDAVPWSLHTSFYPCAPFTAVPVRALRPRGWVLPLTLLILTCN